MRIAVVGTLAETILGFRSDLIKTMLAHGHQVFAFASDYTDKGRYAVQQLGAIPVDYSIGRFSLNPFAELKSTWQLYRLFRRHRIELSFCYFAKPVIYGTLAAWLARVPLRVAKIEGLGRAFTVPATGITFKARVIKRIQVALYRLSLPKAHCVFVLNPEDKTDLIDAYRISVRQVIQLNGIGVNLSCYPHIAPSTNPVRFIFIGRLLNEKGIRYFIDAARRLKASYPATEFIVLGDTDSGKGALSKAELRQLVADNIIIHPGKVADIKPYLAKSSVFVLPSYYREGVPRSTQEAMATGRAIITTDMPGCRLTVNHGVNGYLIPPHNTEALTEAMLKFIHQPELICQMGLQSCQLAQQRFNVTRINQQVMQALHKLQHN
jgi:glycosyltransferase involved in cell wall biosynthesis